MIDWGAVPQGSIGSIYWPAVSAADVIALARTWGGAAGLSSSDAHTLTLKVEGGVSYIPIPKGAGQNFAGLFTVEVPPGSRTGQEFEVVVRRICDPARQGRRRRRRPPPPGARRAIAARAQDARSAAGWRRRASTEPRRCVAAPDPLALRRRQPSSCGSR